MGTYDAVFNYFRKMDKTIKCSASEDEILVGIRNTTAWLQNALSHASSSKIVFAFMLDGECVYYHRGYMNNFSNSKHHVNNSSWTGLPISMINAADIRSKLRSLIPHEVYVTVNSVECTYSVVDFILLEGFYDECEKTNTRSNTEESKEDKRVKD